MDIILKYFPELSEIKKYQLLQLASLYKQWNARINVVSRKDIENLYIRHVLHSLGIAKVQPFNTGTAVMDVGTGGGFPGIPLAVLFPETHFYLVDAVGKKIKVVDAIVDALALKNVKTAHIRVEEVPEKFDFIISRAVTRMPDFVQWVKNNIRKKSRHQLKNGILYLKGGDLADELKDFPKAHSYPLKNYFDAPFFDTKKVIYIPL